MTRAPKKPITAEELVALADRVEALLKAALDLSSDADPFSAAAWTQRTTALASLAVVLKNELKAAISQAHGACRVRIAGVASTGTSGLEGALRNWIAAARRKAAA